MAGFPVHGDPDRLQTVGGLGGAEVGSGHRGAPRGQQEGERIHARTDDADQEGTGKIEGAGIGRDGNEPGFDHSYSL